MTTSKDGLPLFPGFKSLQAGHSHYGRPTFFFQAPFITLIHPKRNEPEDIFQLSHIWKTDNPRSTEVPRHKYVGFKKQFLIILNVSNKKETRPHADDGIYDLAGNKLSS